MTYRQVIQLSGTVDNPSLPDFDISDEEMAVAQIDAIALWPALYSWGVNAGDSGFVDRMADLEMLANGYSPVSGRLHVFADGKRSYNIQTVPMLLRSAAVDFSGSFSIAMLVGAELGAGNYSNLAGNWFIASSDGKLRYAFPGIGASFNDYTPYTGPLLNSSTMTSVILIADREAETVRLHVEGADYLVASMTTPDGAVLSEFQVGGFYSGGTTSARLGHYRGAMVFNKALNADEIAAVEAMHADMKG
ncbi:MAG: hypothetical protein QM605_13430 [Sphingobium sp.]